jgi:hypothetical protein
MPNTLDLGSTYKFFLTATKDGAPWVLTDADVTLRMMKPDGTSSVFVATVVSAVGGTAKY